MPFTPKTRRASESVTLSLLSAVAITALLAGCMEDEVKADSFQSAADCALQGKYTAAQCDEAFQKAEEEHKKSAPRFESLEDCEAEFGKGKCAAPNTTTPATAGSPVQNTNNQGGGFFMPFMMGYMMSNMMSSSDYDRCERAGSCGAGRSNYYSSAAPLYRNTSGSVVTANGARFQAPIGSSASVVKSATVSPKSPTFVSKGSGMATSSRGGFGGTSRGMSVGG